VILLWIRLGSLTFLLLVVVVVVETWSAAQVGPVVIFQPRMFIFPLEH